MKKYVQTTQHRINTNTGTEYLAESEGVNGEKNGITAIKRNGMVNNKCIHVKTTLH